MNFTLYNVDPWLTKLYASGVYLLYSKWLQIVFLTLSLVGFSAFFFQANSILGILKSVGEIKWWLVAATLATGIIIVILHELAHALTTKYYGQHVKSFGFGWLWFGPAAFCNTSDMWLCTHRSRVMVDLAGIYVQMIIAAIASITALFVHSEYWQLFLWLFSLYNYLLIYWNLAPIFDLDGYYVLMDWLDEPNLRIKSVEWLIEKLPHELNQEGFIRIYKNEIIYWSFCFIFIILELIVTFVAFKYLLAGFLGVSTQFYSFMLALLTVIISIIGICYEIKRVKLELAKNKFRIL